LASPGGGAAEARGAGGYEVPAGGTATVGTLTRPPAPPPPPLALTLSDADVVGAAVLSVGGPLLQGEAGMSVSDGPSSASGAKNLLNLLLLSAPPLSLAPPPPPSPLAALLSIFPPKNFSSSTRTGLAGAGAAAALAVPPDAGLAGVFCEWHQRTRSRAAHTVLAVRERVWQNERGSGGD
jgi:hypothetical protein